MRFNLGQLDFKIIQLRRLRSKQDDIPKIFTSRVLRREGIIIFKAENTWNSL